MVGCRYGKAMREAIARIERPIRDLRQFDVSSVDDRADPRIQVLSNKLAGLRNPHALKLTKDEPALALEFIAFVSLLAHLADKREK
jgi:hypothetical protein